MPTKLTSMSTEHKRGNVTVEIYSRELAGGDLAVAVLNRAEENATDINVRFADVGVVAGRHVIGVRDLWAGCAVATSTDGFQLATLATHDTALVRLSLK